MLFFRESEILGELAKANDTALLDIFRLFATSYIVVLRTVARDLLFAVLIVLYGKSAKRPP